MSCKLPYYPMYADDFDEDPNVLTMNLAEVGLYLLALNESWKRGSIPDDPAALAVMIRRKPADVKRAWARIRPCWVQNGSPGKLVNPRQERERVEALKRYDKAQNAALARHYPDQQASAKSSFEQVPRESESESVSESSGFSPSASENASTRTRGEFVDFTALMHRWGRHRGFKKPQKHIRERAEFKWQTVEIDEEELALALDGYWDSEWARSEGYPILGFVKNPHSWITKPVPEAQQTESSPAPAPRRSMAVALHIRQTVANDPKLSQYISLFLAAGKELTDQNLRDCHGKWIMLGDSEKDGAIAHAERNFPQWKLIPSPVNHLAKEPWTAMFIPRMMPEPQTNKSKAELANEHARRLLGVPPR